MKKVIIIPARLNSSRLPNKVLLPLKGKTILQRVYEQCLQVKNIDAVYIATDSIKIKESCQDFTNNIIMTDTKHQSGTDRIAEAVININCDVVINVQGDEPFIRPSLIDALANSFDIDENVVMTSVFHQIQTIEDLKNKNVVKVIIDNKFNALYFSRSIIPYYRDEWDNLLKYKTIPKELSFYRHLGVYAYSREFLLKFSTMEQSYLEKLEKLEQLRVLENGYKIKMIETSHNSIGIDTKEDYKKALEILNDI